eukprot:TRINITY_DN6841_c0_g1_i1.p1 TRINITY_DN6841_c0_g1~~TRINITY_DN6841_c0_g1_i1.p1  ORF type:complete len:171 (+),score=34.84 TRINITY_DN6841_c0_g1_i1:56-568(+)
MKAFEAFVIGWERVMMTRGGDADGDSGMDRIDLSIICRPENTWKQQFKYLYRPEPPISETRRKKTAKDVHEIVKEIYNTELLCQRSLEVVVQVFLMPLRSANIISVAHIESVFCNIENFVETHRQFVDKLKDTELLNSPTAALDKPTRLGEAFLTLVAPHQHQTASRVSH